MVCRAPCGLQRLILLLNGTNLTWFDRVDFDVKHRVILRKIHLPSHVFVTFINFQFSRLLMDAISPSCSAALSSSGHIMLHSLRGELEILHLDGSNTISIRKIPLATKRHFKAQPYFLDMDPPTFICNGSNQMIFMYNSQTGEEMDHFNVTSGEHFEQNWI